ncbi:hypothetical protein AURDEDRAFT_170238 [Auricularia subglabra TFB-10046 SS5]|nr:hypothetical protein AURDEDRAFT_170238 [Auricularia subglabra TFB-10046 SS5]
MKDTTKRSPTADSASSSRRKEKHVSRACNGCRRRKSKCDGVQPVCGTCAAQKHECSWTTEEDGRRPATKAQVDAMSMEIRTLKDERDRQNALVDRLRDRLRALGQDPDAMTPPHAAAPLSITIPSAPASHAHARAHSEGGGQYLGIPSPISFGSHSPVSHSPLSVASSLPSPMPSSSSQFLTVPGFGPSRGPSPEPSVYGSSSTDDDEPRSAMSDSDNDAPMAPFVATRKRLLCTYCIAAAIDFVAPNLIAPRITDRLLSNFTVSFPVSCSKQTGSVFGR